MPAFTTELADPGGRLWTLRDGLLMIGLPIVIVTLCLAALLGSLRQSRAGKIPGPWSAQFSNVHRLLGCARGTQMDTQIALHRRYGPLVRVGPNTISIADGNLISDIYSSHHNYLKSDTYAAFDVGPGMPTMFSCRDNDRHRAMKRALGATFSLRTTKELEPMIDSCTSTLLREFDRMVNECTAFDIGQWLHFHAFDVMTSVTFGENLGFVEKGEDVGGIKNALYIRLRYVSIMSQMTWLYHLINRVWVLRKMIQGQDRTSKIVEFAAKMVKNHNQKTHTDHEEATLLDRLQKQRMEGSMTEKDVLSYASANIIAGSDTTGITLTALTYHLLRNPACYQTLQAEIDAATSDGQLSHPVLYDEAQKLPYLQAVIKETLRIHPAVGMLLERVVPEGGADFGGISLPAGTVVGVNPWVSARDEVIYEDPESFKPERWLIADPEREKLMERNLLSFGAGSRGCTGKYISLMEMSKIIPELLMRYEFELVNPKKEWKLFDYFFVWQSAVECRVRRRMTGPLV